MTTSYPKRLIEVDLPIKRISAPASQEKRVGARAHVWWSWKPLSACRSEILAAALPDPCDPLCPPAFLDEARKVLTELRDTVGGRPQRLDEPAALRAALLDLVAAVASSDLASQPAEITAAQRLVVAARRSGTLGDRNGNAVLADPFAGSGSIPLEGIRLGLDAFATDLNPVAVFLEEVVLRQAPILGPALPSTLRKWGAWVQSYARERLQALYPHHRGGTPIAYLWLRSARCAGPNCGIEVPLASKLWLAKKGQRHALLLKPHARRRSVDVEIVRPGSDADVGPPTVRLGSMTCPVCGFTTKKDLVRAQLAAAGGGVAGARLACVVVTREGERGRYFEAPSDADLHAVKKAAAQVAELLASEAGSRLIPNEPIPQERVWKNNPVRVHLYGVRTWGDLFSPRQALAMASFVEAVRELPHAMAKEGADEAVTTATAACLSLAVDRMADHLNTLCRWNPSGPKLQNLFSQQAIPFIWDYAEANPFGDSVGDWMHGVECVIEGLMVASDTRGRATVQIANATKHPLPDDSVDLVVTDPPYYDQVPYATVSEFFYVWLKRCTPASFAGLFKAPTTPKDEECVIDDVRHKDKAFFERTMRDALTEARRIARPDAVAVVIFAHKTTSGWEALLQAVIDAGWVVTASWPLNTELGTRMRAQDSAALASSIHLVCRPRENPAGSVPTDVIGDWRDVLAELPKRIHEWMPRLTDEGIVGADAIFACLGPALEIYSRYSRVEKASGEQVTLKEYLEHVWAAVAKEALSVIFAGAETSGFEEDARLTAMWLWTLSTGGGNGKAEPATDEEEPNQDEDTGKTGKKAKLAGFLLEYDAARKIAQGLGAHFEDLASLVEIKGETARLLPVSERTRALFGKDESDAPTARHKKKAQQMQLGFADELEEAEEAGGWGQKGAPKLGQTVLDRVHQSMILFAAGRGEALRRFLVDESAGRDARFWRLAQALAALYPTVTDERRWVEGVLARKKGLGL